MECPKSSNCRELRRLSYEKSQMSWVPDQDGAFAHFPGARSNFRKSCGPLLERRRTTVVMMNENISALLDDELEPQVAEGLLDRMRRDGASWQVEHLLRCRRALRPDSPGPADDFYRPDHVGDRHRTNGALAGEQRPRQQVA